MCVFHETMNSLKAGTNSYLFLLSESLEYDRQLICTDKKRKRYLVHTYYKNEFCTVIVPGGQTMKKIKIKPCFISP